MQYTTQRDLYNTAIYTRDLYNTAIYIQMRAGTR